MVKVTSKQMGAINAIRITYTLKMVLNVIGDKLNNFTDHYKVLNYMTIEQIVLAWHGHAEVEPEFVSFDEAMRAKREGKIVKFHPSDIKTIQVNSALSLFNTKISSYSLDELFNGKFTIEGDK